MHESNAKNRQEGTHKRFLTARYKYEYKYECMRLIHRYVVLETNAAKASKLCVYSEE
jgi:hypothetical protein